MRVKIGDIVTFRGCCWNDGWEFGAPLVIYEPIRRYCESGGISPISVADKIEDLCIDLCVSRGEVKGDWHPSDLKEFKWRGWNPKGFKRRKNACHAEIVVKFVEDRDGGLAFETIAACGRERKTGKISPLFQGVPATKNQEA